MESCRESVRNSAARSAFLFGVRREPPPWCAVSPRLFVMAKKDYPRAPPNPHHEGESNKRLAPRPVHRLTEAGAYIITAGTYQRQHFFDSPERLTILHDRLLDLAQDYGCQLQAWAVLSNHYHIVTDSPDDPSMLSTMIRQLHWETAVAVNDLDGTPGRKVWFNYWDKHLTFEKSYLARLNYVHYNPQKHGLCLDAEDYIWCSASWFSKKASPSFLRTVRSFRSDRLTDPDPF